ncbi:MAG: hypothetical protein R3F59_26885 [Myxococcota bacterium]
MSEPIGRAAARAAAEGLLRDGVRLVTLWGPPGIGKTTLAAALPGARRHWVGLAGVAGVEGLVAAVAAAVSPGAAEPDLQRLAGAVLVLDNLEHLLESEGEAVLRRIRDWLAEVGGLQIVATSRRLLRIPEEHAVALEPLGADDAVALFVAGVQRRRAGWAPDGAERADLAALVSLLEGVPLAIELAAARWELLGTAGLLQRLSDPLRVLAQPRAEDPRHATLRSAIAWSWDLLAPAEQEALQALSRLEAPFDVDTAEAMLGDCALEHVEALRDAALVQVGEPGRFALLASIRAFAREHTPAGASRSRRAPPRRLGRRPGGRPRPRPGGAAAGSSTPRRASGSSAATPAPTPCSRRWAPSLPGASSPLLDDGVARLGSPAALRPAAGRCGCCAAAPTRPSATSRARSTPPATRACAGRPRWYSACCTTACAGSRRGPPVLRGRVGRAARAAGTAGARAVTVGNLGAIDHDACRYEDAEQRYAVALQGLREVGDRRTEATFLQNHAVLLQEQGRLVEAEAQYGPRWRCRWPPATGDDGHHPRQPRAAAPRARPARRGAHRLRRRAAPLRRRDRPRLRGAVPRAARRRPRRRR